MFLGLADSPLPRRLAPEEPGSGAPQVANLVPSELNYPPGLDLSQEKSELKPTEDFVFISTHYQTDLGLMFQSEVQFRQAACHAHRVIRAKYVTAQDFRSLLGRLVSMSDLLPLGPLRCQPLQLYLLAHWCASQGQLLERITLDHPFLDPFLCWWTKLSNVLQTKPLYRPLYYLAVYTDAFTNG